jgi:hypothetical protein
MRGWRKTPLGTAGWVVLPGIPNFTISGEQILSKLSVVAITTVLALAVLSSRSFAVTNAVVGRARREPVCHDSGAVNAATAGSVVQVCPGTYPEQVAIPNAGRGESRPVVGRG